MQKSFTYAAPLLVLFATQAFGQVRVDARLEQDRYLEAEPVFIVVHVLNAGDKPVVSSICNAHVSLTIVGVERRRPANISGCFSGMGGSSSSSSGGGCAMDPPPVLAPTQSTSFRYVLKDYDLGPGLYSLTASGTVPGAQFERTFLLNIVPASDAELKRAFARHVADAEGDDWARRNDARAAIIESAPRFLDSLIGQFAFEGPFDAPAIDALGRIASDESRSQLKQLFERNRDSRRQYIVLTLARVGHGGDAEFFARVLQDAAVDHWSRRYAALGLGHIGGEHAVRYLERALPTAPPEIRPSIAMALGNTGSRLAVPVLISMFGNNPERNQVCSALTTLTHRDWCGAADDPAAARRKWLRRWNESGSSASIYGPDSCPESPQPTSDVAELPAIFEAPKASGPPAVTSVQPLVTFPNTILTLSGHALRPTDTGATRVLFMRDGVEHAAKIGGAGATGAAEYLDVVVPEAITPGRWQIVIDVNGRRSAPVTSDIAAGRQTVLRRISPERPHPSQWVQIDTRMPAQVGDQVELTDEDGKLWRLAAGVSSTDVYFTLPDEVAEGEATVRVGRSEGGVDRFSTPLTFVITSGPLPLKPLAVAMMKSVAPGQWTDLVSDQDVAFEIRRADRIEVEFRQRGVTITSEVSGIDGVHVQVPKKIAPGPVSVRTRTWIEKTASEWSAPTPYRVLERPVAPAIAAIEAGPVRNLVWWIGHAAPAFAGTKPGEALVLRGHFPVARAADLRVQLRRLTEVLDLSPTDVDGGVRVQIPGQTPLGDWRLVIGAADGLTPLLEITTVRVM